MPSTFLRRAAAFASASMVAGSVMAGVDFKTCSKPVWPVESLRLGQTGTVQLAYKVGKDGKASASQVEKSSGHPLLDIAALEGIGRCTFKPMLDAGKDGWLRVQYVWTIAPAKRGPADAMDAIIAGAAGGDPAATWKLGMSHLFGREGVRQDSMEAMRLLERAATLGHTRAYEDMAQATIRGMAGTPDLPQAEAWLRKAADAGSHTAQAELGRLLVSGRLGMVRRDEGMPLLKAAAEQGLPLAQGAFGHELARRVDKGGDFSEALRWLEKAAAQEDRFAQYRLGYMYRNGIGVTQDYARAAALLQKPAAAGLPYAVQALNEMVEAGQAVRPSGAIAAAAGEPAR